MCMYLIQITMVSFYWVNSQQTIMKRNDYATRPQRSSLLQWYRSCKYKGLEKGLADRASKSKSIAFKSESLEPKSISSKNGLKSGLEYYKSVVTVDKSNNTDSYHRLKLMFSTFICRIKRLCICSCFAALIHNYICILRSVQSSCIKLCLCDS